MKKTILISVLLLGFLLPTSLLQGQVIMKKKETLKRKNLSSREMILQRPVKMVPTKFEKLPVLNKEVMDLMMSFGSKSINSTDNARITIGSVNENQMSASKGGQTPSGENCYNTPKTVDVATSNFSWFTGQGGAPAFVIPGVVMHYNSILTGANTIIGDAREPMDIYLNNPIAGTNLNSRMITVENPARTGNIINGMGQLVQHISDDIPANMSFTITEINSEKELQYAVTGSYDYSGIMASASVKFGVSNNDFSKKHYYMVEFNQHLYTIVADPNTISFKKTPQGSSNLVSISEVSYGRRGVMLIETSKSTSDFQASASIGGGYGFHSTNIDSFLQSVKEDNESKINLFFYGGRSSTAAAVLDNNDVRGGFSKWLKDYAGSGRYALPISYRLKSLKGEDLKMVSVFNQTDRDCIEAKSLKLKVTLLGIEPWRTRYGSQADYGVQMGLKYVSQGKKIPEKVNRVMFPNRTNCDAYPLIGATSLICGDMTNQFHPTVNKTDDRKFDNNIGSSIIYTIPKEAVGDRNAKFEVGIWVKEYSSNAFGRNDLLMNIDFKNRRTIDIYNVLAILQGAQTNHEFNTGKLHDSSLNPPGNRSGEKFELFDRVHAPMVKIATGDKVVLDAVFRARNEGSNLEKAWMFLRFELID